MPDQIIGRFEELAGNRTCIDSPQHNESIYDECISICGWTYSAGRDPLSCRLRGWLDGKLVGETRLLFARSDVSDFLSIPRNVPTGFRFLGRLKQPLTAPYNAALLQLSASWTGDPAEYQIAEVRVQLIPATLQKRPYGEVVCPSQSEQLRRASIYGSGPPLLEPGMEMQRLILGYLSFGSSVVDVGCGAGAYGPGLIAAGHQWTGLEVNPHCLELLRQRGLQFRKTEGGTKPFPCEGQEFDEAICIEVLEHIAEPDFFLSEIARVVRRRALFSVPNLEVLPYFKDWEAVPWHMLEADHKNFFTRNNLRAILAFHFSRVEVFSCIELPLRTRDGIPLHGHLMAVAEKTC